MDHDFTDSDIEYNNSASCSREIYLNIIDCDDIYLTRRDVEALAQHFGCILVEAD